MKILRILRLVFAIGTVALIAAYSLVPNYARALTPGLFGTTKIMPGVYTDAPDESDRLLELIAQGDEKASAFFGTLRGDPRIIICTTPECQTRFGFGSLGLAVGSHAILIGPEGINPVIFAHERVHIELHKYMGLRDLVRQRIPAWFDEGMATHLAQDDRLTKFEPSDAAWIIQAQSFRDWSKITNEDTWKDTYGAAQSLVADLDNRIGPDGLRRVIEKAIQGEPIERAIEDALATSWP